MCERQMSVRWEGYLDFLDSSQYSLRLVTFNLAPEDRIAERQAVRLGKLNYQLWPFQRKILDRMGKGTLVVGLPTGLGKTYLAGAYIQRESEAEPIRVLFLTPSVPLGVQQTLFARHQLNLRDAHFISGSISPERRRALMVWNSGFAVTTPQTFYNDVLKVHAGAIEEAKGSGDPVVSLAEAFSRKGFAFPYSLVVADECHGYIGETDGYSILLSAKAAGAKILALSATPQLHAPQRLSELKRIFERIETVSVEEPEINAIMPERVIAIVKLSAHPRLLEIYRQLDGVINAYSERASRLYGASHARGYCRRHGLCVCLIALKIMRSRIVEDGASSVLDYGTWKIRELKAPVRGMGGRSIYSAYRELLAEQYNHKISAALDILGAEGHRKAIVFVESVEAAKQVGGALHGSLGMEEVAVLVGKGDMSMEQQASALLQFRDRAAVLVCTSIGEEGLDIPSADIEIWVDPPSNPKKWIQRFGRILRQSEGKKIAKTYALITAQTHERNKLLGVMKKVEKVYGFTQRVTEVDMPTQKDQKTLSQFF